MASRGKYRPIDNYGLIGDLHTVALVSSDGSIDWCCLPHFSSPSLFAAILDEKKGGFFRIGVQHPGVEKQMYLPETNVLVTRFLSPDGVGELIDFMPLRPSQGEDKAVHEIVRQVRAVRGSVCFELECYPAFDYARSEHELKLVEGGAIWECEGEAVGLSSPAELTGDEGGVRSEFTLETGESMFFLLRHVDAKDGKPPVVRDFDGTRLFEETVDSWRRWVGGVKYRGRWREMMERSALTLKLLTYQPTGAIVAAPTTSLPEAVGGERNWDYRYTWIRDAAFTVYAFVRLGLTAEADAFMSWIEERSHETEEDGSLQVMYGIHGEHELPEVELSHLEGYKGSAPVRIGNAASNQLQLDIYGELMDSVYLANKYSKPLSYEMWTYVRRLLDYVMENWQREDEGIWEIRGGRHHMVYSKMMNWVAMDRGLRLSEKRSFPAPREKWFETRDKIYEEIMERGWSEEAGSFVQHYETKRLDASNLIMPLTFFISPTDPRMQATLDATMKTLASDSLVHRYETEDGWDGLSGDEGTFSMCTFWLVEALTRAGRVREARLIFEKMLSYSSHLGLYAEQIGASGEALGNFPQAFTHMGLISAAFNLNRTLGD